MSQSIRVALVSGSLRKASFNTQLVRFVGSQVENAQTEIDEISLAELDLPLFSEDLEAGGIPDSAKELKRRLIAADAVLYASPEYNGSLTAALKNAIDWATRPNEGEAVLACYRGKVAGLLAASPGKLGGIRGMRHLRTILASIGNLVVAPEFGLGSAHEAFDDAGRLKDDGAAKLAVGVGSEVVRTARALKSAG